MNTPDGLNLVFIAIALLIFVVLAFYIVGQTS